MQKITFELPLKISTNKIYSGIHWNVRSKHKELYYWSMKSLLNKTKLNKIKKFPVDLIFDFKFKSKPLDTTNCSYMLKLIEDSLVKNKILPDDDIRFVRNVTFNSSKGKKDEVCIQIDDNVPGDIPGNS